MCDQAVNTSTSGAGGPGSSLARRVVSLDWRNFTPLCLSSPWAQLFEGRLALNPGLNLTQVSFSFVQKHFLRQFSLIFIEHRIINLLTKRIKLNLLYKLSYLNSNFALTLGYLNLASNNPAQVYKWVPATYYWGVTLRWTSIPSRGE